MPETPNAEVLHTIFRGTAELVKKLKSVAFCTDLLAALISGLGIWGVISTKSGNQTRAFMFNKVTKVIFSGTALAPCLMVMAIVDYNKNGCPHFACFGNQLLFIAICLVVIAYSILYFIPRGTKVHLKTATAQNTDKDALTFLIAYLLPLLSENQVLFKQFDLLTLSIIGIIFVTVYHTNSYVFNPLLSIVGYHFYDVTDEDGFKYLLITKRSITRSKNNLFVYHLFDTTYLEFGSTIT